MLNIGMDKKNFQRRGGQKILRKGEQSKNIYFIFNSAVIYLQRYQVEIAKIQIHRK